MPSRFRSITLRPAASRVFLEADGAIHKQLPYEQPPGKNTERVPALKLRPTAPHF